MLALLNSHVVDFFHHQIATQMRGGWYSYESRFIRNLPIAEGTESQTERIVDAVNTLIASRRYFSDHRADQATLAQAMLSYWERMLNGLVYELYFPEEVHGAGLRLFDLVEAANLPNLSTEAPSGEPEAPPERRANVDSLPDDQRLAVIRAKFEELHADAHPLRIALDKLQALEVVRIIEGRE